MGKVLALIAALTAWPRDGVPRNPEAWLLTTARHSLVDFIRHQRVVLASEPTPLLLKENSTEATLATQFPDERLKLLFVCAHPAMSIFDDGAREIAAKDTSPLRQMHQSFVGMIHVEGAAGAAFIPFRADPISRHAMADCAGRRIGHEGGAINSRNLNCRGRTRWNS